MAAGPRAPNQGSARLAGGCWIGPPSKRARTLQVTRTPAAIELARIGPASHPALAINRAGLHVSEPSPAGTLEKERSRGRQSSSQRWSPRLFQHPHAPSRRHRTVYRDVLGLEARPRPSFSFPGAWMYSEGRAVVHLVDISPTDEPQNPDSGVVHHVAFVSRGFSAMKMQLEARRIPFRAMQVPDGEVWQIFVRDPNGVMVELNYTAADQRT